MSGNNRELPKTATWCAVQSGANGSLVRPSLIHGIFQGIFQFWAPELLLILLGNEGFRALGTQIR